MSHAQKPWSWTACCICTVVTVLVSVSQVPSFWEHLRPRTILADFVQEWASARNWFQGMPIYESQRVSLAHHLHFRRDPNNPSHRFFLEVNAHPPSSVVLALPFGLLDYPDAVFAWNLLSLCAMVVSLWLLNRELHLIASPWAIVPIVGFLLWCGSFRQQVIQGQWNLILLLLITGIWVTARRGQAMGAGILLGTAIAIKLFPGFLMLYFLLRRQWKVLAVTTVTFLALTGGTVLILGIDTYKDYIQKVLPHLQVYRSNWVNASLAGFWHRLFGADAEYMRVQTIALSPFVAQAGTFFCVGVVVTLLCWATWPRTKLDGPRDAAHADRSFALTVVTMLLVSPITWDHYFLVLIPSMAVFWTQPPPRLVLRGLLIITGLIFSINLGWYYIKFIEGGYVSGRATSVQAMTVLSLQLYALLMLFIVGFICCYRTIHIPTQSIKTEPRVDKQLQYANG